MSIYTYIGSTNGGHPSGNYPTGSLYMDNLTGTTWVAVAANTWVMISSQPGQPEGPAHGPDVLPYLIEEQEL